MATERLSVVSIKENRDLPSRFRWIVRYRLEIPGEQDQIINGCGPTVADAQESGRSRYNMNRRNPAGMNLGGN